LKFGHQHDVFYFKIMCPFAALEAAFSDVGPGASASAASQI
jgi:hypothetical protein